MYTDYFLDGKPYGEVACNTLMQTALSNPGLLRPFLDRHGIPCVIARTKRMLTDNKTGRQIPEHKKFRIADLRTKRGINFEVWNATSLTKEGWEMMDARIIKAVRIPMQAWADLAADNPMTGFDGWSVATIEHQAMSDPGEARIDMDPIVAGRTDIPLLKLYSLPLPVIHADHFHTDRQISISGRKGLPVDTVMTEANTRRMGEMLERLTIGTETGLEFGTQTNAPVAHTGLSKIYGYTNFPSRITKTDLHTPSAASPEQLVEDVIEALEQMRALGFYGPYRIYHSTGYSRFFQDDYFRTGGTSANTTLEARLATIKDIESFRRLNFLTSGYQLIVVDLSGAVPRPQAVIGMPLRTVQWPSKGGLMHNYKSMFIMVPRFFSDYNGLTGLLHATTS